MYAPKRRSAIAAIATCAIVSVVALPVAGAVTTEVSLMGAGGHGQSLKGMLSGWVENTYGVDNYVKDEYPASLHLFGLWGPTVNAATDQANANIGQIVGSTDGHIVITVLSLGAIAATKTLNYYRDNPDIAPSPDTVSFVLIGNPNNKGVGLFGTAAGFYNPLFGLTYVPTPEDTPYRVDNFIREYDGFADGVYNVHDVSSLLGFINSFAGIMFLHPYYASVDPTDPSTLIKTVGNTTYHLIRTERLPMLAPLYQIGDRFGKDGPLDQILDKINAGLKKEIDKSYDRSGYQPLGSLTDPASIPAAAQEVSSITIESASRRNARALSVPDVPVSAAASPGSEVRSTSADTVDSAGSQVDEPSPTRRARHARQTDSPAAAVALNGPAGHASGSADHGSKKAQGRHRAPVRGSGKKSGD